MTGFEKATLATGEARVDYIRHRLRENVSPKQIHSEINAVGMYGGPEGKTWPISVVYAEKRKLDAPPLKPALVAAAPDGEVPDLGPVVVPPEYEGILTEDDVAEVQADAKKKLLAKQKAAAMKDLLAKATADLEREARLAAQRGAAKGDLMDIQIDLAPYAADIRLDGEVYEHARMYRVRRSVYCVLMEQMQRSWQHESSLHGANDRPFRRSLADRGITANNAKQMVHA